MNTGASIPEWLRWARAIQALSQTGLAYSTNMYERERNERLQAIAAEMLAAHTPVDRPETLNGFSRQLGYATPKIDVRGAVVADGRILLVRETVDGRWSLPGGWAEVGQGPSESAVREVYEESGLTVAPVKLVGVFDANRFGDRLEFYHAFKVVFLCRVVGGECRPSAETSEVGFFDFDAPPPLSAFRTPPALLAEIRAHLEDPARPAAFD